MSIPVVANGEILSLFTAKWCSLAYSCHLFFVHWSTVGHFSCFQILAFANNAAANMGEYHHTRLGLGKDKRSCEGQFPWRVTQSHNSPGCCKVCWRHAESLQSVDLEQGRLPRATRVGRPERRRALGSRDEAPPVGSGLQAIALRPLMAFRSTLPARS